MDEVHVIVVASNSEVGTHLAGVLGQDEAVNVEIVVADRGGVVVALDEPDAGEWRRRLGSLSPRQREVLQELVDGRPMREAAERLFMSSNTYRSHVKAVLAKLGAHSSLEAASIGVTAGLRPSRPATGPPEEQAAVGVGADGVVDLRDHDHPEG